MTKQKEECKVVSIFKARKRKEEKDRKQKYLDKVLENMKPEVCDSDLTFEEIIQRNMKNLERMRKERQTKNKGVLRSYHIKH